MSIELGFALAVAIVVTGAWAMVGWLAWLKHRDNQDQSMQSSNTVHL